MDRMSFLLAAATFVAFAPVEAHATDRWQAHIVDAAKRFRVPENWIRAVIDAESNGDPHAVSPKGALGLMQLMPGTWDELRVRHNLGADPFDPRTNILAGTAYLDAMHDRFGYPGVFAAYNAGPARYEKYLHGRASLPAETRSYLSGLELALATMSGTPVRLAAESLSRRASAPRPVPRFVAKTRLFFPLSTTIDGVENRQTPAPPGELFVPLSTTKRDDK